MNHNESWTILELEEGSTPEAVEAAFSRRNVDLAQRIAAAATPALRQKYERQAERLRQARDRLLGSGQPRNDLAPLTLTKQRDLPVATPMVTGPGPASPAVKGNPASTAPPRAGSPGLADSALSPTRQGDLPRRRPLDSFGGGGSGPDSVQPGAALGITLGQVLAERFEVRAVLGSGGMGAVFAALDRVRAEEVAVKVLLPHLLADPKALERFLNEAKIASSLSHPHIVRVYDVHQTAGLTFLTMELLKGHNLREEIARRAQTAQRFSVVEVRSIASQLCAALQFAHRETVHRDVKPENIWVGEDGSVKLMDFGIARLLRPSQFTSTGLALGTAYYMAPEQVRGQEVDYRADQFALGVVLYELMTGEIPQGVIKPPHQLRRSIPAGLSRAVMTALEARPEARYSDMAALGRALAARSRSGAGTWTAVGTVAALLLVGAITFPSWKRLILSVSQAGPIEEGKGPSLVGKIAERSAEEKAAEETYRTQWSQIEALKKQAETVGSQIESEVGKSPGEIAGQVVELWRRHSQRKEWLVQAEKSLASAQGLAARRSFAEAKTDLKAAEAEYRKPQRWRDNARQALEAVNKTREALEERSSRFADRPHALVAWPETLQTEVEERLLQGDGEEGLALARRAASAMPAVDVLIEQRRGVAKSILAGRTLSRVGGLQGSFEAVDAAIKEADQALVQGRFEDARRLYRKAAERGQSATAQATASLKAAIAAGDEALDAEKFDEALSQFEQVVAIRSQWTKSSALPDSDGVAQLGPILSQAYRGRAGAFLGKGQHDRAIADCDEALRIDPRNSSAYINRGDAYSQKGDNDRAIVECTEAIRLDPNLAKAYYIRGEACRKKRDYDRAIADCTEAIRIDPNIAIAYCIRGESYFVKHDFDRAITDYTEAIRLDPKYARAYNGRGDSYRLKGNKDRAVTDCTEAIRLDPNSATAYLNRGLAYGGKGDVERAITDLTEAIRLDPNYAEAYTCRALAYVLGRHDYDRAVTDYSEAIRIDPKNAVAYDSRGTVYSRKGDWDRAITDYSEAIRLDPKLADAYDKRAAAYIDKGIRESDPDKYHDLIEADSKRAKELRDRP